MKQPLLIGWTTVANEAEATALADGLIERGLAACVQIDGGVRSVYRWQGRIETEPEHRLMVKFPAAKSEAIDAYLKTAHPYEVHEWVVVEPSQVSEAYAKWARDITAE